MRPFPALATLALVTMFTTSSAMAAGEVYKWTDDKGVAQYTDSPPDGRPFTVVNTGRSKPPAAAQPEAQAIDPATGEPIPNPLPVARTGSAAANCATAQANVDNLTRYTDVNMDRNGDGTPEKLTDEERKTELERSQTLVKLYCLPAQAPAETEPAQEG